MTSSHPSSTPVTALVSWAHADPGWDRGEIAQRQEQVVRLAQGLRGNGIDVDVDLFHATQDVDWTRWGPARIRDVDIVLVVVSQAWRDAWEGRGDTSRNVGAAAEADVLRTLYSRDRSALISKCRVIVLPGSESHVPDGMDGIPRFRLDNFEDADLEDLLRDLTNQPAFVLAPLGTVPVLPATTTSLTPSVAAGDSAARPAVLSRPGRQRPAAPVNDVDETVSDDRGDEVRQLRDALRALPTPQPGEGPHLPWYRTRETIMRRLSEIGGLDEQHPSVRGGDEEPNDSGELSPSDGLDGPEGPAGLGDSSVRDVAGDPANNPAEPPAHTRDTSTSDGARHGAVVGWRPAQPLADDSWYGQWSRTAGFGYNAPAVVVHVVPQTDVTISQRRYAETAERAPSTIRAHPEVSATDTVRVEQAVEAVSVIVERSERWHPNHSLPGTLRGARLAKTGQVSVWRSLPRDHMGAVIDAGDLHGAVRLSLQTAAALLPSSGPESFTPPGPTDQAPRVVVAAELIHVSGITDGTLAQLGHRSNATMHGALRNDIAVGGDESIEVSTLHNGGVNEVADVLAALLNREWRS